MDTPKVEESNPEPVQPASGAVGSARPIARPRPTSWRDAVLDLYHRPQIRSLLILALIVVLLIYPQMISTTNVDAAIVAEVWVLLALGLNIVVGFAGLLDLGYAAFFAIGAYTLAFLGSSHFSVSGHSFSSPLLSFGSNGIHINFFLMIPIAALTAALCGVLFGAPTLRLRGDYLAIVTLGFGEIVPKVIQNLGPDNSAGLPNITNGVNRITGIDSPPDFTIPIWNLHVTFQGNDERPWYYLGLIIVIVSIIAIISLRSSRIGRAWNAIREDEIAAAHMGINITRTRLTAFGIGAAFSGFGGLIEASRIGSVDYTQFLFAVSITILVMVIFGGMGSIPGVIVGAILVSYLDISWLASINSQIHTWAGNLQASGGPIGGIATHVYNFNLLGARQLVYGLILLTVMLLRPQGLWPARTRARELHPQTSEVLAEENAELYTAREG